MLTLIIADPNNASAPPPSQPYTPGWCGVHVTQYQKSNPSDPNSHYKLDITIKDGAQVQIGSVLGADAPAEVAVDVGSALPYVLEVIAQNGDDDAVLFRYGDQSWGSNDQAHHCDFGAYDSGNRNGDCGFSC